jgi:hypothetical protein
MIEGVLPTKLPSTSTSAPSGTETSESFATEPIGVAGVATTAADVDLASVMGVAVDAARMVAPFAFQSALIPSERILDRVTEGKSGMAHHRIATDPTEYGDLVSVSQVSLAPLVVEDDNIVSLLNPIIGHHLRTSFAESLDDLSGLRPRPC